MWHGAVTSPEAAFCVVSAPNDAAGSPRIPGAAIWCFAAMSLPHEKLVVWPANIVEGIARRSRRDTLRFLNIAEASLAELGYWPARFEAARLSTIRRTRDCVTLKV